MLEAEAKNLDKSLFLDGISFGLEGCAAIAQEIHAEVIRKGIKQRPVSFNANTFSQIESDVALLCEQKLKGMLEQNNLQLTYYYLLSHLNY